MNHVQISRLSSLKMPQLLKPCAESIGTVDGSEIWRAPVDTGSLQYPIIYKVYTIPDGWKWDF